MRYDERLKYASGMYEPAIYSAYAAGGYGGVPYAYTCRHISPIAIRPMTRIDIYYH